MPSELPKTGAVEPRIIRGEIPEAGLQVRKKKRSPWERHVELAREFPARLQPDGTYAGGWVECAVQMKGGPRARQRMMGNDRRRLMAYVESRFPRERYQIACRTDPGTWCDLRMFIRFLKELTPEEDRLDRIERHKRYEAMMANRRRVAAERELKRRRSERSQG